MTITNEPTEAQVEAAWQSLLETATDVTTRADMRAALVAAQGATPQAEIAPKSSYISPSLPGMIRNLWKSDPSENSVRTALKLAGDLIQELIDLRAAPVQPSRTVDELAKLIRRLAVRVHVPDPDGLWSDCYDSEQKEWQSVARAVVEAIGGEGRDATDEN